MRDIVDRVMREDIVPTIHMHRGTSIPLFRGAIETVLQDTFKSALRTSEVYGPKWGRYQRMPARSATFIHEWVGDAVAVESVTMADEGLHTTADVMDVKTTFASMTIGQTPPAVQTLARDVAIILARSRRYPYAAQDDEELDYESPMPTRASIGWGMTGAHGSNHPTIVVFLGHRATSRRYRWATGDPEADV